MPDLQGSLGEARSTLREPDRQLLLVDLVMLCRDERRGELRRRLVFVDPRVSPKGA